MKTKNEQEQMKTKNEQEQNGNSRNVVSEDTLFRFPNEYKNMPKREALNFITKNEARIQKSAKYALDKAKRYSELLKRYQEIADEILG